MEKRSWFAAILRAARGLKSRKNTASSLPESYAILLLYFWQIRFLETSRSLAFLGKNSVLFGAVTAARLFTTLNASRVERAADDVVTNARQVADTAAADKNDGVFLELVSFARNVNGNFFVVRETNARDAAKSGVRLFRLHGTY